MHIFHIDFTSIGITSFPSHRHIVSIFTHVLWSNSRNILQDENNLLKTQNGDLTAKLRRAELLYARVSDELAKYRVADGKAPVLNFDEEQRLHKKLQVYVCCIQVNYII